MYEGRYFSAENGRGSEKYRRPISPSSLALRFFLFLPLSSEARRGVARRSTSPFLDALNAPRVSPLPLHQLGKVRKRGRKLAISG